MKHILKHLTFSKLKKKYFLIFCFEKKKELVNMN